VAKLSINEKFFSQWTPEMSYVLGVIAVDGYLGIKQVGKRGNIPYFLDITSKDFKLLKKNQGGNESSTKNWNKT